MLLQALPEVEEKVSKLEREAASLDATGEVC
jgi:exonuclease VII small subunit